MTDLVLSGATSFFSGSLKKLFHNAKKYGFKYVEIIPYWWSDPYQVLELQKLFGVTVAGIHLPFTSWQDSAVREVIQTPRLVDKVAFPIIHAFMGKTITSSGIKMAELLSDTKPYLLIHQDVAQQMLEKFIEFQNRFHVVVENIINDQPLPKHGVFDHGHFTISKKLFPHLDMLRAYREAQPEVIHISYDNLMLAGLPNKKQQIELKQLLQIHQPRYITIETNPLVSIKKAKLLLEKILSGSVIASD